MEELVATMNRLIEQNAEQSKTQAKQTKVLAELIAKQGVPAVPAAGGGGLPAVPAPARKTPEEILRDKISLLHQLLTKSPKVKDYKTTNDQPIKEWLIDFEETLNSIAKLSCNLDLEAAPLTRDDYVDILRDKLGSQAKKEINRAFEARTPVLKWSTITSAQLKEVLLTQFGDKKPDISAVFNPSDTGTLISRPMCLPVSKPGREIYVRLACSGSDHIVV